MSPRAADPCGSALGKKLAVSIDTVRPKPSIERRSRDSKHIGRSTAVAIHLGERSADFCHLGLLNRAANFGSRTASWRWKVTRIEFAVTGEVESAIECCEQA